MTCSPYAESVASYEKSRDCESPNTTSVSLGGRNRWLIDWMEIVLCFLLLHMIGNRNGCRVEGQLVLENPATSIQRSSREKWSLVCAIKPSHCANGSLAGKLSVLGNISTNS